MNLEQNFDCTQFITFDGILSADENKELIYLFQKVSFNVIPHERIFNEKIEYQAVFICNDWFCMV